ncbi:hypothetical protein LCGC14_1353240 [marine sediment metagenome]|uniref:Uncharacterized protein n=1 Tax=marine sediment metagenome TaxID=412755 RepID=A0A0F9KAU7_9ZZZZ|nr:hypothetical protein [Candidatus Aminicenantes bacterium]
MNLKAFDKFVKRDCPEWGALADEIRKTFVNYEESLRLLHNCLLNQKPIGLDVKFWEEVENFLNEKLEEI